MKTGGNVDEPISIFGWNIWKMPFVAVKLMNTIVSFFAGNYLFTIFSWKIDGHNSSIFGWTIEKHRQFLGKIIDVMDVILRVLITACQKDIDVNEGILQRVKDIYIYIMNIYME